MVVNQTRGLSKHGASGEQQNFARRKKANAAVTDVERTRHTPFSQKQAMTKILKMGGRLNRKNRRSWKSHCSKFVCPFAYPVISSPSLGCSQPVACLYISYYPRRRVFRASMVLLTSEVATWKNMITTLSPSPLSALHFVATTVPRDGFLTPIQTYGAAPPLTVTRHGRSVPHAVRGWHYTYGRRTSTRGEGLVSIASFHICGCARNILMRRAHYLYSTFGWKVHSRRVQCTPVLDGS